ncbi:phage shock protein E precursor [Lachnospiraceae bacterium KM106-2]|nr:phage shock protein E precursor [Lachnospiraceae bacterium KM106-2]
MLQKTKLLLIIVSLTILTGCGFNNESKESNHETPTTSELQEMINQESDLVVLDVRTESEYLSGHIPNAILLPYDQISEQAEASLPDKDAKIIVYCHSGRRSAIATKELTALGYTNIYNFGAISNWTSELATK